MALRSLPVLLSALAIVALAGCGGDDDGSPPTTRTVDEPCPGGTPELGVRDVLPKPPNAPSGRQVGTGVGVLNLTVRADDESPPATTATRQQLTIAGRDGVLRTAPGGGPARASASVGKCGVVVLNGPDEASVRRVAAAIRQPE